MVVTVFRLQKLPDATCVWYCPQAVRGRPPASPGGETVPKTTGHTY